MKNIRNDPRFEYWHKKPWHVPVVFVKPGVDPIEARRFFKQQPKSDFNPMGVLGAVALLILLAAGGWWWYAGRTTEPVEAAGPKPAAPATLIIPTNTPLPTPVILTPTVTITPPIAGKHKATSTPTPTPTPTATSRVLTSVFQSPIKTVVAATPRPPHPLERTPTPSPFNYEIIANIVHPEPLYPYISGWVVEQDGTTPRPIGVELVFPTGTMEYPRPNNRDIATGYYEFMVSPGDYELRINDNKTPVVFIHVEGIAQRYEVSFRYLGDDTLLAAVVSNPWQGDDNPAEVAAAEAPTQTPTPTPPKPLHIYLPVVLR